MESEAFSLLSHLATLLIFCWAGYRLSPRISQPREARTWIAWLAALLLAGYVGVSSYLLKIGDFGFPVNAILQGLIAGILLGFMLRTVKQSQ